MTKEKKADDSKLLAVKISNGTFNKMEDHIDKSRLQLRKRQVAFTKKQMYEYLFEQGIRTYKEEAFVEFLNGVIK